jgi:hypothetical protein
MLRKYAGIGGTGTGTTGGGIGIIATGGGGITGTGELRPTQQLLQREGKP